MLPGFTWGLVLLLEGQLAFFRRLTKIVNIIFGRMCHCRSIYCLPLGHIPLSHSRAVGGLLKMLKIEMYVVLSRLTRFSSVHSLSRKVE
jgi:hypothetical protein